MRPAGGERRFPSMSSRLVGDDIDTGPFSRRTFLNNDSSVAIRAPALPHAPRRDHTGRLIVSAVRQTATVQTDGRRRFSRRSAVPVRRPTSNPTTLHAPKP